MPLGASQAPEPLGIDATGCRASSWGVTSFTCVHTRRKYKYDQKQTSTNRVNINVHLPQTHIHMHISACIRVELHMHCLCAGVTWAHWGAARSSRSRHFVMCRWSRPYSMKPSPATARTAGVAYPSHGSLGRANDDLANQLANQIQAVWRSSC